MDDFALAVGDLLDRLLGHFGVHGVNRLDAAVYVVVGTVILGLCAAVPSAVRVTLRRSAGR